jgi:hypothetical protein
MPQQLLWAAREQAAESDPPVRAAALLHIARVLTVFDRAEAELVLDRGLALIPGLPERDRDTILGQAISLVATVSPRRALSLVPSVADRPPEGIITQAIFDMLGHGHAAEAISYLTNPQPGEEYPFNAAGESMAHCKSDETRLQVSRGAIRALRDKVQSAGPARLFQRPLGGFLSLFTRFWRLLPREEAIHVLRDPVR